jgi:hypothetical protein
LGENWAKIGQKLGKNWAKIGQKLGENSRNLVTLAAGLLNIKDNARPGMVSRSRD